MSTIYIQPIFVPDEKRFERNLNSLKSFSTYVKENNLKIPCIFGGWGKEEYMKKIIEFLSNKENGLNIISIQKFNKNYGKAIVVNTLFKTVESKKVPFDYFLTADSDILFKLDNRNFFDRLENAAKQIEIIRKKPFGLISLQQEGQCCHLPMIYKNKINFPYKDINESVVYPDGNGGIAGGCLFFSKDNWVKIGGYRVLGVYAGDDAYSLIDTVKIGNSIQMFESLSVVHPPEDDVEYQKWKGMVCQRDSAGGRIKNNIDDKIKEAENFWSNKND